MFGFHETLTLDEGEKVVAAFRSHTLRTVLWLIPCTIVLFGVFLFMFPLFYYGIKGVVLFFVIILLDAYFILLNLLRWYGSVSILTERRLFVIYRVSFLKKRVNEILLENINELSYDTKGILQTLFGYGTVHCSLFTSSGQCDIPEVNRPQEVLNVISKYASQTKAGSSKQRDMAIYEKLPYDTKSLPLQKSDDDPANWR
jgi:hypothetical protein